MKIFMHYEILLNFCIKSSAKNFKNPPYLESVVFYHVFFNNKDPYFTETSGSRADVDVHLPMLERATSGRISTSSARPL